MGWQASRAQMNKQGGWWLNALVHYDPDGAVLLSHRVTGEVRLYSEPPFVSAWGCCRARACMLLNVAEQRAAPTYHSTHPPTLTP